MLKAKANFNVSLNISGDHKIDVYVDKPPHENPPDVKVFLVLQEPVTKWWEWAVIHHDRYDYLLTYFPSLLHLDKAIYFHGVTPQVRPLPDIKKENSVSFVMSGRQNNEGHYVRRRFWNRKSEVKKKKNFYLSSQVVYDKGDYTKFPTLEFGKWHKEKLMTSMYHIAIDTERYFFNSEKLIDCFLTKTIPIYWGAPHYKGIFNPKGVIHCDNEQQIIDACNKFGPGYYDNHMEAIKENYDLALSYDSFDNRLSNKINTILNG